MPAGLKVPVVLLAYLVAMQGCKNPGLDNIQLIPSKDYLNLSVDSVPVNVITQVQAPQVSSGISQAIIGSVYDWNFGTMYGGFYAQLPLNSAPPPIAPGTIVDSVVLSLAYGGQFGLCHKPIDLAVYELADPLLANTNYYTNTSFSVKSPALALVDNFIPQANSSVYNASTGTYQSPYFSIRLSKTFGQQIIDDLASLQNDSVFLTLFKGIYVTATSGSSGDGMAYINLNSPQSNLAFYYHSPSNGNLSETVLPLTFSGVAINHYDCIHGNTPVQATIDAGTAAQSVYLEAGSGAGGLITFSLDSTLKGGKVGISKAEIVFSQSSSDGEFASPPQLNLLRVDDAGQGQVLDDAVYPTYGGVLTSEAVSPVMNINRYRYNITRYFQKLVQGVYNNNGLFLQIQNGAQVGDRVVLSNIRGDKNYKISLAVTYTKI